MKSLGWTLILYGCCSNKRGEFGRGHRHVPRKNNLWRRKFWNQPRTARTLGERPEIDLLAPSGTPLTTFWSYLLLPEPFLLLKPLRLWQFIMPLQLNTMNRAQGAETTQNTSAARGSGHQERVCLLRPRLTKKEHPLTEGFSVPAEKSFIAFTPLSSSYAPAPRITYWSDVRGWTFQGKVFIMKTRQRWDCATFRA